VNALGDMKREGLTIQAISELTGFDRKTVRRYLLQPEDTPVYGPRGPRPSRLDPFKPYLAERMAAGVWNAQVLLRELRGRGYPGRLHDPEGLAEAAAGGRRRGSGAAF